MESVYFDTGSGGSGVVEVQCNIVYGTDFGIERYGQTSQRTGDGTLVTYDNTGLNLYSGKLIMKNVSYTHGVALRTWLSTQAVFELTQFDITLPSDVDLGNGKGVKIEDANFVGTNDNGVFKYVAPGLYVVEFPYSYIK